MSKHRILSRFFQQLANAVAPALLVAASAAGPAQAGFITFESVGANPGAITPTRDDFRTAVGGGTLAGVNGSFGGTRREINWDGVGAAASDPNPFPGNTFLIRGAVFSTPGTGFLVSANAGGAVPPVFGFPNDFQAFSLQKLFTAVNSNITDVNFFVPGTNTLATTSAFAVIFTDVETAGSTSLQFFDKNDQLIYSHDALTSGNLGLTFLGAVADAGERISRVRIISGANTIVSNGVLGGGSVPDAVVMDDFLYAEPTALLPVPATLALAGCGLLLLGGFSRRAG